MVAAASAYGLGPWTALQAFERERQSLSPAQAHRARLYARSVNVLLEKLLDESLAVETIDRGANEFFRLTCDLIEALGAEAWSGVLAESRGLATAARIEVFEAIPDRRSELEAIDATLEAMMSIVPASDILGGAIDAQSSSGSSSSNLSLPSLRVQFLSLAIRRAVELRLAPEKLDALVDHAYVNAMYSRDWLRALRVPIKDDRAPKERAMSFLRTLQRARAVFSDEDVADFEKTNLRRT